LDRFFSGLCGQPINGLSFFVLSLINVAERKSYPLAVKQIIRSEAEKEALREKKASRARKSKSKNGRLRGRPKGSRNKVRTKLELSPELLRLNALVAGLLKLIRVFVRIKYLALDGHFGHNQAV